MAQEIFIGRRLVTEWFRKQVFFAEDGEGRCLSLVGPNGIGKTALIRHLQEMFEANPPADTFYYPLNLPDVLGRGDGDSDSRLYWRFWSNLVMRFAQDITPERIAQAGEKNGNAASKILAAHAFFESFGDYDNENEKRKAALHLDLLFKYYTQLGFRIIITIDEFDIAKEAFTSGILFQRLFSLSPKGSTQKLNLSIVTISRRDIGLIAHHMEHNSNIKDAYPPETLRGFDEEEMEEYFSHTRKADGSLPDEAEREQIRFFCGRNPGLLMRMRDEIETAPLPLDISAVYRERGAFIRTAYDRMCTLLEQETVVGAGRINTGPISAEEEFNTSCMSAFIQYFIGPVYSEQINAHVEKLYEYGFVTRMEGGNHYEPLSAYLTDYIRRVYVPDMTDGLIKLLETTELEVRKAILEAYRKRFPDTWEEEVDRIVNRASFIDKSRFLDALRQTAQENDCAARGIEVTLLDVLSFKEYAKLIRDNRTAFGGVFGSLGDDLTDVMNQLYGYRNTGAHANIRVLDQDGRRQLRAVCQRVLKSISNPAAPPAFASSASAPLQSASGGGTKENRVGQTVTITDLGIGPKGNLTGTISGSADKASVSKAALSQKGRQAGMMKAQGTVRVRLVRYDRNAGKYNAEIV